MNCWITWCNTVWYKKLGTKLQALAKLGWRDRLLLTEAWLTLAWVDLVISVVPYRYWRGWLETQEVMQQTAANPRGEQRVAHIIHLSESAARHHLRPMNCLRRSLTQQRLLRRRHLSSNLHIGVRTGESALEAHAWLSWQGKVLNDTPDVGEHYAELQAEQWGSVGRFTD